jgi:CBS domain-containing protein
VPINVICRGVNDAGARHLLPRGSGHVTSSLLTVLSCDHRWASRPQASPSRGLQSVCAPSPLLFRALPLLPAASYPCHSIQGTRRHRTLPTCAITSSGANLHRCAQGSPVAISITPIHTIQPDMPLTTALSMLLEAGISALPVVDSDGVLLDVYARGDITLLACCNAYSRLQYEDMTVGQALSLVGGPRSQVLGSQAGSSNGVPTVPFCTSAAFSAGPVFSSLTQRSR